VFCCILDDISKMKILENFKVIDMDLTYSGFYNPSVGSGDI
jgi:hypothetical protein